MEIYARQIANRLFFDDEYFLIYLEILETFKNIFYIREIVMRYTDHARIEKVFAREILDSRGNPTVEATVLLSGGAVGVASAPSGASTGKYEAHELRDEDDRRFFGKGVLSAVENVNGKIAEELVGEICDSSSVDTRLIRLDGSENKKKLGANATLAVSLAAAKAAACNYGIPLYKYIGGVSGKTLPIPMMNILNGGAHASNNIDIQEFMIMPCSFGTYSEALRVGCEVYHMLGRLLKSAGHTVTVGDEGGFAPNLSSAEEALEFIVRAIGEAGYEGRIKIALDVASSEWAEGEIGGYTQPKKKIAMTSAEMVEEWSRLSDKFPIISIEDGLGEDDHVGWREMTARLGGKMMLVGDDYFVTNEKKLGEGIKNGCGNAILIKPNQIGTLTETLDVIRLARRSGYSTIISHRSGETSDTTIADIAVGMNTGYIKTGAPTRGERTAKYNRLTRIEGELCGGGVFFGGNV